MQEDLGFQRRWRSSITWFSAITLVVVAMGLLVAYSDGGGSPLNVIVPSRTAGTSATTPTGLALYSTHAPTRTPTPILIHNGTPYPTPTLPPNLGAGVVVTPTPMPPARPTPTPTATPKPPLVTAQPGAPPTDTVPPPTPTIPPPTATPVPTFLPIAFSAPLGGNYVHPGLATTTTNIHTGLVFNSAVTDPNSEVGAVDVVWGSSYATQPGGVVNLAYVPSTRIGFSPNHQLLYSTDWFLTYHPDWIEYQCDQATIAYSFGEANTPLDIFNPDVQTFLMQQEYIPLLQAGYSGLAFDNVEFINKGNYCGHRDLQGNWVAEFNGQTQDTSYEQAYLQWARTTSQRIHAYSPTAMMGMNLAFDYANEDAVLQLLPSIDFLTDERSFTDYGNPTPTVPFDQNWLDFVDMLHRYSAAGGSVLLIDEEPSTAISHPQMQWALANYLLVKGNHTYLTVVGQQQYGQFYDHPEYHAAIGTPITDILTDGCAYRRDFTGGLALVNPSSAFTCTTQLPSGNFLDLYGHALHGALVMPPGSAIVLLRG